MIRNKCAAVGVAGRGLFEPFHLAFPFPIIRQRLRQREGRRRDEESEDYLVDREHELRSNSRRRVRDTWRHPYDHEEKDGDVVVRLRDGQTTSGSDHTDKDGAGKGASDDDGGDDDDGDHNNGKDKVKSGDHVDDDDDDDKTGVAAASKRSAESTNQDMSRTLFIVIAALLGAAILILLVLAVIMIVTYKRQKDRELKNDDLHEELIDRR